MLHRAIFGSLERFFGVLIESTAGTKCILTLTLTLSLTLTLTLTLTPATRRLPSVARAHAAAPPPRER